MKKNRKKKKVRLKKWVKVTILISIILLVLGIIVYVICSKSSKKEEKIETVIKEELESDTYKYYINSSASDYEKEVFEELKKVLSKEEINEEEYANTLAKVFISNLFTLNSKNNSSDISSSQYVYDSYQETYKTIIKDTIYSSIELNLNGERTQELPEVSNVEVISTGRIKFFLNKEIIDEQAFDIKVNISYVKDLGYPKEYNIVLVENNDLLQVAKSS